MPHKELHQEKSLLIQKQVNPAKQNSTAIWWFTFTEYLFVDLDATLF